MLPAAALLTRQGPVRTGGALVLAHSQQGLLAHTLREAEAVHELLGGEILRDELANQDALRLPPRQVLHIAAHGEFRIDQPDLAYIALADGRLYTDDFLQHDLGYELITLSACETGRANVLAGEELIGLGRGCLLCRGRRAAGEFMARGRHGHPQADGCRLSWAVQRSLESGCASGRAASLASQRGRTASGVLGGLPVDRKRHAAFTPG